MGAHSHVGLKPLPTVKRSRACASVEIARAAAARFGKGWSIECGSNPQPLTWKDGALSRAADASSTTRTARLYLTNCIPQPRVPPYWRGYQGDLCPNHLRRSSTPRLRLISPMKASACLPSASASHHASIWPRNRSDGNFLGAVAFSQIVTPNAVEPSSGKPAIPAETS